MRFHAFVRRLCFSIIYGLQTGFVWRIGHLHIYEKGFFEYGAGNPGAYGIRDYEKVISAITHDPQIKDMVLIATPMLSIAGIAGNFSENVSKPFFGTGVVPSDHDRMKQWNDYNLRITRKLGSGLSDSDIEGGVIGIGMARILHLCDELKVPNCQNRKYIPPKSDSAADIEDFSALAEPDQPPASADKRPKIDLLAATVSGAPNVVSMYVNKTENQGFKELDDNYVAVNISLAQKLLYGRGEKKVTGIVLQLKHTKDMAYVKKHWLACLLI
ncbi:MAG: hypothetical protein HC887_01430 [Desulfobacteraceae bacterium]|nr:hypothetical protein [Desulfobacteraceae bacterium]